MLKSWSLAQILRNPQLRENLLQTSLRQNRPHSKRLLQQRSYFTSRQTASRPQAGRSAAAAPWHQALARRFRALRFNSTQPKAPSPNATANLGSPEPQTLSARMKKLSREYGWSALGVYFALSALDFPFCFLAVRLAGTDRIAALEHWILEGIWTLVEIPFPHIREGREQGGAAGAVKDAPVVETISESASREGTAAMGWGVEEAEQENKSDHAGLWTQLALAYAIHKSFIFIRVPLTAAVTPKVVKTLRKWGWDIGKRKPKGAKAVKKSE